MKNRKISLALVILVVLAVLIPLTPIVVAPDGVGADTKDLCVSRVFYGYASNMDGYYDCDTNRWLDVVGLEDNTKVYLYDITETPSLVATAIVNRMKVQQWYGKAGVPIFFKIVADKPVVATVFVGKDIPPRSYATFYPTVDGSFVGRDFIFEAYRGTATDIGWGGAYDASILAVEDATVNIYDATDNLLSTFSLLANKTKKYNFATLTVYHVNSTGKIMIRQSPMEDMTLSPSTSGNFVGKMHFGSCPTSWGIWAIAYEPGTIKVYKIGVTPTLIATRTFSKAGEFWNITGITSGGFDFYTVSTGNVSVGSGFIIYSPAWPGGIGASLGYPGYIGGDYTAEGAEYWVWSAELPWPEDGGEFVIFAHDTTSFTVNGTAYTLKADEHLFVDAQLFPGAVYHIVSDKPLTIIDFHGCAHWGSYLASPSSAVISPPPSLDVELFPREVVDLGNATYTCWHELHPVKGNYYNLTFWNDTNADGKLSAGDEIDLRLKPDGPTKLFSVDNLTVAMNISRVDSWRIVKFEGFLEEFMNYNWTHPLSSHWREVNPNFTRRWQLTSWVDKNGDSKLSSGDEIDIMNRDTSVTESFHVETLSTDMWLTQKTRPLPPPPPPPPPPGTGQQILSFGNIRLQLNESNMDNFFYLAGEKMYEVGNFRGTFLRTGRLGGDQGGIWSHPYKVLNGCQIAIHEEGQPEWFLNDCRKAVNHFAFLELFFTREGLQAIRLDLIHDTEPAMFYVVKLKNTATSQKNLRLKFAFNVNIRPSWYSGIEHGSDTVEQMAGMFVAYDDFINDFAIAFGSQMEPVAQSVNGNQAVLEYNINLQPEEEAGVEFLIVAYDCKKLDSLETAKDGAINLYSSLVGQSATVLQEKEETYQQAILEDVKFECPEKSLQDAFYCAKANMKMLTADLRPYIPYPYFFANPTEYTQLFGCDNEYCIPGTVAAGFLDTSRDTLKSLAYYGSIQDGRIPHEVTTNGRIVGAGNTQETPHFTVAVWDYFRWTGDTAFLAEVYPLLKEGVFNVTLAKYDTNGNYYPEGPGVIETGGMGPEKLDSAVWTWKALQCLSKMASVLGLNGEAAEYAQIADYIKPRFNIDWWNEEQTIWATSLMLDGTQRLDHYWTLLLPMKAGIADVEKGEMALNRINREKVDEWGYINSPLHTCLLATAEYKYNYPETGRYLLERAAYSPTEMDMMLGGFHETMPTAIFTMQSWCAAPFLEAIIEGMMGLEPDALSNTLVFAPQIPSDWESARLSGIKIGDHIVDVEFKNGNWTLHHRQGTEALHVTFKARPETDIQPGEYAVFAPVRDIAITDITPSSFKAYPTWAVPMKINVTVENVGDFTETFPITLYWNNTNVIGTKTVTLNPQETKTLTYDWTIPTTVTYPYPTYTLSANATLPGDNNPEDNTLIGGTITVRCPGDATGDGKVNIYDLTKLALSWRKPKTHPAYNPLCDFTGDGEVNIFDLIKLAKNWRKGPIPG